MLGVCSPLLGSVSPLGLWQDLTDAPEHPDECPPPTAQMALLQ